jgi:hypothetical protein
MSRKIFRPLQRRWTLLVNLASLPQLFFTFATGAFARSPDGDPAWFCRRILHFAQKPSAGRLQLPEMRHISPLAHDLLPSLASRFRVPGNRLGGEIMMRRNKGLTTLKLLTAGAFAAFAMALSGGQAHATLVAADCTAGITPFANGIGSATVADISGGHCVLAQDKLYGNFTGALPSTTSLTFNLQMVNGQDRHQLTFTSAFVNPSNTAFGYEVAISGGVAGLSITQLDADFNQPTNSGTASILRVRPETS